MDHQKKLEFIHKMAKLGLEHVQHFDTGGVATGLASEGVVPAANAVSSWVGSMGPNTGPDNQGLHTTAQGVTGGINNWLGTSNNFQGQAANITPGTNQGQLNAAYTNAQGGVGAEGALAAQTSGGVAQGLNAQSTLSQQLANEAAGQGPNPAQAALNQATRQNISQQAALAAGQRGAGTNAGLLATQNAQTGAATQQAAAGQAATLQAQQQLAAQNAAANLASTQVTQGQTAATGLSTSAQNEQNILQNANTSANNANVAMQSNINNVNAQVSEGNQNQAANTVGGITGGGASLLSNIFAEGGVVGDYTASSPSAGPSVPATPAAPPSTMYSKKASGAGGAGSGESDAAAEDAAGDAAGDAAAGEAAGSGAGALALLAGGGEIDDPEVPPTPVLGAGVSNNNYVENFLKQPPKQMNMAKGGRVPAMVSPGERYLSPVEVKKVMAGKANPMEIGKVIPGTAKVEGDSLKNDTVPKTLQAGGLVIPRHITQHPMAHEKALAFIHASMAKKGLDK